MPLLNTSDEERLRNREQGGQGFEGRKIAKLKE